MNNSTRRNFIILSTLLFIVVVLLAIPYSQGWRWNSETKTFQKVGGLYILSHPTGASIYLNGKHQANRAGILDRGTLISNLNPGEYTVHLNQIGFNDWQRKIIVEPERVSELKNAVLVPKLSSHSEILATSTTNFWLVSKEIISQNATGTVRVQDTASDLGKLLLEPKPGDRFILMKNSTGTPIFYDLKSNSLIRLGSKLQNHLASRDNQLLGMIPDQTDSSRVYLLENHLISVLNVLNGNYLSVSTSTAKNYFSSATSNGSYLAASLENILSPNSSAIRIIHLDDNKQIELNLNSKVSSMDWAWDNQLLVLDKNGSLWLWKNNRTELTPLASKVTALDIAPDRAHLAAIVAGNLTVWSLVDNNIYASFPISSTAEITDLSWYQDDHHLFVQYPDKVSFLEINDSHLENMTDIVTTPKSMYDGDSNRLYYLDGSDVKFLQFPNG